MRRRDPVDHGLSGNSVVAGNRGSNEHARIVRSFMRVPVLLRECQSAGAVMLDFQCESRGVAQVERVALTARRFEPSGEVVTIAGDMGIPRGLRGQDESEIKSVDALKASQQAL